MLRPFIIILTLIISELSGQSALLQGRVVSDDGPVPYASVILVGTHEGAVADQDGVFQINNLPVGEVLM